MLHTNEKMSVSWSQVSEADAEEDKAGDGQ